MISGVAAEMAWTMEDLPTFGPTTRTTAGVDKLMMGVVLNSFWREMMSSSGGAASCWNKSKSARCPAAEASEASKAVGAFLDAANPILSCL